MLISPAELAELLDSAQPTVLADVRWNLGGPPGRSDFEARHIPGAVWVDLEAELSGPAGTGGRHPLPQLGVFEQAMRRIGVRQESLVVTYDAATSQAAARLWWLLSDAGHHQEPAHAPADGWDNSATHLGIAIDPSPRTITTLRLK